MPRGLDQDPAHPTIAVLVNRKLPLGLAAGMLAGAQPGVAGDLPAVLEAVPVAYFEQQRQPGECADAARRRDSFRLCQLGDAFVLRDDLAGEEQRLPVAQHRTVLLLRWRGRRDRVERMLVAPQVAIELLAECTGVAGNGFGPAIERHRRHDVTVDAELLERAMQPVTARTGFVARVDPGAGILDLE